MSVGVQKVDSVHEGAVFSGTNLVSDSSFVRNDTIVGLRENISDTAELISNEILNGVSDLLRTVLSETTTPGQSGNLLQNEFTTNSVILDNYSSFTTPDVTISRKEVTSQDVIGTAEKVVIGAAVIVVVLAIIAIILRLCAPYLRSRDKTKLDESDEEKTLPSIESFSSKLSGIANLGADISSTTSGFGSTPSQDCSRSTGSTPLSDWSDNAKSENRSTDGSDEMAEKRLSRPKVEFEGMSLSRSAASVTSIPVYCGDPSLRSTASNKGSPALYRKLPVDQLSHVSSGSLEPARFEQNYRDRWDDQWDPQCSMPRGNLSHLSHPSESRLSLNTLNSVTSSTSSYPSTSNPSVPTFPIPSREFVRQLYADSERRYPSSSKAQQPQKKENHVRLSPSDVRKTSH
ncbi:uncharacterized protein LOC127835434 [Dreissena polymorpha]|uniref:Uncharacterized protein n=1 Tax=Dreissena polymorpha TaxID=45954 RepID=A0A9D4JIG8_DREPO|nr:uncharacterized protein LOC127835434 [Dreissena polymorpha]KAH3809943.1 hypothetical protein DPMN_138325 [Dreissena polymorpha]